MLSHLLNQITRHIINHSAMFDHLSPQLHSAHIKKIQICWRACCHNIGAVQQTSSSKGLGMASG